MKKSPLKLIVFFLLAVFVIFLLGRFTFLGKPLNIPGFVVNSFSYLFDKFNIFHKFTGHVRQWKSLSAQNERLEKENNDLLAGLARIDILEEENAFLKKAAGIKETFGKNIVYAHVFNFNLGHDGYNVLLNKGTIQGIAKDDVVITEEQVLVGIIQEVSANSSRVLFVSDTKFRITAKVIGSATSGIVKGALSQGMYFDLVAKEDEIKEGDILISTGNDLFPAALIIGKVAHVEVSESQTFKKIRIDRPVAIKYLGRVIILTKQ